MNDYITIILQIRTVFERKVITKYLVFDKFSTALPPESKQDLIFFGYIGKFDDIWVNINLKKLIVVVCILSTQSYNNIF